MSRLILPGDRPKGALTIYVPRGLEDGRERQGGGCYLCGTPFRRGEDPTAHFKRCGAEHLDEIRAQRAERRKRLAAFQEENWDPELQAHFDRVGERMLREGRLHMKPNERSYD